MLRQLSCLVSSVVGWEVEERSSCCPQDLLLSSRIPVQLVDEQRMQAIASLVAQRAAALSNQLL